MDNDKIFKKLVEHDKRFEEVFKRFDGHDKRFERIVKKLVDHDEEFIKVRGETRQMEGRLMTHLDGMMVILQRLDQERVFTFEYIKRVEADVDRIKKVLKIA